MALPPILTDPMIKWIRDLIAGSSCYPDRDLCLWAFFTGTPCTILELNRIQVGDVLTKKGRMVKRFVIRGDKGFTGKAREVLFTNKSFTKFLKNYLDRLVGSNFIRGDNPDYYRGLDPLKPLFITKNGEGFALTKTEVIATKDLAAHTLYKPDSLRRHILNFMSEGGIENPSSQSGRRTFATKLKRNNRHISQIHHLLGFTSLEATKRLIGNDPDDMGAIAAEAY